MRTRTIVQNIYTFNELSEKAKRHVIEDFSKNNMDGWDEYTLEYAKEVLKTLGFSDITIEYRGFWSQGDGARFIGTWDRRDSDPDGFSQYESEIRKGGEWADVILSAPPGLSARIRRWYSYNMYSHENTVEFEWYWDDYYDESHDTQKYREAFKSAMRWVYRILEAEYERVTSFDEYAVISDLSGWEYLEDGTIV